MLHNRCMGNHFNQTRQTWLTPHTLVAFKIPSKFIVSLHQCLPDRCIVLLTKNYELACFKTETLFSISALSNLFPPPTFTARHNVIILHILCLLPAGKHYISATVNRSNLVIPVVLIISGRRNRAALLFSRKLHSNIPARVQKNFPFYLAEATPHYTKLHIHVINQKKTVKHFWKVIVIILGRL